MRRGSLDDYCRDPVGKFVAGAHYVVWAHSPRLAGCAFVGRVDDHERGELAKITQLPPAWADPEGFDIVVDCERLDVVDPPVFAQALLQLRSMIPLVARMRRAVVVRPQGITGAVIAGLYHDNIQPRYDAALFAERTDALTWLGLPPDSAPRREVEEIMTTLFDEPAPLGALRALLAQAPTEVKLVTAARALRLSERSLSRRLQELGTSFRAEVQRARLRAAEALLVTTDLKLEDVSRRVGFQSRAHFSQFFHRATGETPAAFRTRRAPPAPQLGL